MGVQIRHEFIYPLEDAFVLYLPDYFNNSLFVIQTLEMTTIWCGYYDGNKKSKRVQEKLGFIYHHTCDEVPVPLLNEVRVGHTNVITKEQWKSHTQPDGKIHVANIEEV